MASCDDDFSLLGDDNTTTSAHPSPNPNPNPNPNPISSLIHHRQSFGHRAISTTDEDNNVVSPDADGFSDGAFCSSLQNSKRNNNSNASSYHIVNVHHYDTDPNPFDNDPDLNKSRIDHNNHTQLDKRTDHEEVSDNGTSYHYKRSRMSTSAAGGSSSGGGGGGEYRKDREEWSDSAIACLLEAYTEKFMMLNRGNLRGRDWEEVAVMVSERCDKQTKSVEQCKNKVDNLKKRYKLERHRLSNGGSSASHWPWVKQMEHIVGNSVSAKAAADDEKSIGGSSSAKQSKRYGTTAVSPCSQINNIKSKSTSSARWRRVIFKISGAALAGMAPQNIDPKVAMLIAREVSIACRMGVEVAIVVGGRNFFCGDTWVTTTGLDRCTAYQIGMMATVMNSMLLQSALEKLGVQTRVQSAFSMPEVAEPYSRQRAIRHLEKGRVVIFGGIGAGTGNPLFSTDTAAALRASEIHADAVLKGTNVEGLFVCDSRNNNSVAAEHVSFGELTSIGACQMDMMAIRFCDDNGIPVVIFNLHEPGNISRALCGEQVGTLIDQTGRVN